VLTLSSGYPQKIETKMSSSFHRGLEEEEEYRIALASVTNNGITLRRISPQLQCDESIVLAAVTQNGRALQYASPILKGN
jgi:hypothetical protein